MDVELRARAKPASEGMVAEDVDNLGYSGDDRDLIRLGKKPVLKVCL